MTPKKPNTSNPGEPSTTYEVTLQHSVNGKVKATKACDVTADSEDEAIQCALEVAGSCQGGMFNTFLEGKHELTVVSCTIVPQPQRPIP